MVVTAFCPKCGKMLVTKYGPFKCHGYSFRQAYDWCDKATEGELDKLLKQSSKQRSKVLK